MLRPAGFSSGRGECARGGMFCGAVRFCRNVFRPVHAGHAFLLGCFSFVLCLSYVSLGMSCVRFYPNVLHSFCACHAFLSKCPVFDHACCLPPVRQTERLAICSVPIPPWVVIAIRAFSDVARLSGFVGSLRACAFLYGDPDGERKGTRGTEAAARCKCAFACPH